MGSHQFDAVQVIPGDVLEFLKQFDATPTARHHYKARLSTFFAWCVLKNYIPTSPCDKVRLSAPPKCKGKWDEEKFWKLHAALPPIGQVFLELCFLTRQRSEDIRLLQESSIGKTHIHFQPGKTINSSGEETDILLTPEIKDALDRARKLVKVKGLPGGSGYLIQTSGGTSYTATGLRSMFSRACQKVALPMLSPKSIRPFALKAMEDAGHDLREIQKSAAHTTSATTEGYLNQYRDRVSNAVTLLPAKPKT
jgi:integrase